MSLKLCYSDICIMTCINCQHDYDFMAYDFCPVCHDKKVLRFINFKTVCDVYYDKDVKILQVTWFRGHILQLREGRIRNTHWYQERIPVKELRKFVKSWRNS